MVDIPRVEGEERKEGAMLRQALGKSCDDFASTQDADFAPGLPSVLSCTPYHLLTSDAAGPVQMREIIVQLDDSQ